MSIEEKKISLSGIDTLAFYGAQDKNIRTLSDILEVNLVARGNEIALKGEKEKLKEANEHKDELSRRQQKELEFYMTDRY